MRVGPSGNSRAAITCGMPLPCEFGKNLQRQEDDRAEAERRQHERKYSAIGRAGDGIVLRAIGQRRHEDRRRTDKQTANEKERPASPSLQGFAGLEF